MIDPAVLQLCRSISDAGGRALLVGGWVRDFLRGSSKSDYDLEVYRLEPATLRRLLERHGYVNSVGAAYTVFKVRLRRSPRSLTIDVSLPRRESKVGRGHRGFVVTGDPDMSFTEAARRRDFTVNAILYDPLTSELIDPFDGRADLDQRLIRVVDPTTFVEDSLRVLRAMQLSSRLEFVVDPATITICREIDLHDLPAERIWGEVEKWLLHSEHPSIGLRYARDLGICGQLWPEIEPLDHHRLAQALDDAVDLIAPLDYPRRVTVMLATLCRNFLLGTPAVDRFLDRLKIHTVDNYDVRHQILAIIAHCHLPGQLATARMSDGEYRRLALRVEPGLLALVEHASSPEDRPAINLFLERVRRLGISISAPPPILMGRHLVELGLPPGARFGEIIRTVYQLQLDDQVTTLDQAIIAAQQLLD
jgi:tRNA nucleotidyltransferase (CCA-adding enzyme)